MADLGYPYYSDKDDLASVAYWYYFEMGKVTLPLIIITAIYFGTIGLKIQKKAFNFDDVIDEDIMPKDDEKFVSWKMWLCGIVTVLVLLGFVLQVWNIGFVAMTGAVILLATRCLDLKKSLKGVDWNTVLILGAAQAMANGGYRTLTLSPASVQEACDLLQLAFELAEKYRQPVLLLGDAMVSQMMEPVDIKTVEPKAYDISWAARGWTKDMERPKAIINPRSKPGLEARLQGKYLQMAREETMVEEYNLEGAEIVLAAYGTVARICKNAIVALGKKGVKVGLIRPITLFPFPYDNFAKCADRDSVTSFASIEISEGQMIDDVKLGVNGKKPVAFKGWLDLSLPTPAQIVDFVMDMKEGK